MIWTKSIQMFFCFFLNFPFIVFFLPFFSVRHIDGGPDQWQKVTGKYRAIQFAREKIEEAKLHEAEKVKKEMKGRDDPDDPNFRPASTAADYSQDYLDEPNIRPVEPEHLETRDVNIAFLRVKRDQEKEEELNTGDGFRFRGSRETKTDPEGGFRKHQAEDEEK